MYGAYQNVWAQHPQDHPIWRDINHVRFPAAPSLPPSPLPLLPSPPPLAPQRARSGSGQLALGARWLTARGGGGGAVPREPVPEGD